MSEDLIAEKKNEFARFFELMAKSDPDEPRTRIDIRSLDKSDPLSFSISKDFAATLIAVQEAWQEARTWEGKEALPEEIHFLPDASGCEVELSDKWLRSFIVVTPDNVSILAQNRTDEHYFQVDEDALRNVATADETLNPEP